MTADERKVKLPVWVKHELAKLRNELEVSMEALRAFSGSEKTAIQMDPYGHLSAAMYAPDRMTVRFHIANGEHIDVSLRDGAVLIMGSSRIRVLPSASNVVTIESAV